MPRLHLALPLAVVAVVVAVSACTRPRQEETTHVIPPPAPYLLSAVTPPAPAPERPAPPAAEPVPAPALDEDAPSAEEREAFARPVLK